MSKNVPSLVADKITLSRETRQILDGVSLAVTDGVIVEVGVNVGVTVAVTEGVTVLVGV